MNRMQKRPYISGADPIRSFSFNETNESEANRMYQQKEKLLLIELLSLILAVLLGIISLMKSIFILVIATLLLLFISIVSNALLLWYSFEYTNAYKQLARSISLFLMLIWIVFHF